MKLAGQVLTEDESRPAPDAAALPLVVDLDGTLLRTDTLFECAAAQMRVRLLWTLLMLMLMPFAKAKAKRALQRNAPLDVAALPVNADVRDYCRDSRAMGRKVYLVSAADQGVVEAVAIQHGLFDGAVGSDGRRNNKGAAKARRLIEDFPNGFEYVGDSSADMKVWRKAKAASHVGGGSARKRTLERMGVRVERSFEVRNNSFAAWRKQLRLHQWAKNGLLFVAPVLSMKFSDVQAMLTLLIAFALLGIMASGTYILNDLLDLSADRNHHSKSKRPFAAGRIKLWQGFLVAPLAIAGGLAGGFLLSPAFGATMLIYVVATLSYSTRLKRVALLDVVILASLYTLRLVMGGVLTGVALTQWLLVFSMFLFVSLSLAKRHVEVIRKSAVGERTIANRGYQAEDAMLTLGLGLATAAAVPLILVLYLIDSAWPSGLYRYPDALWAAPITFALWLMRVWLLANRAQLDDDPVLFAVKDPISLTLGAALLASFLAAASMPFFPT